jgi:hypothetical protein
MAYWKAMKITSSNFDYREKKSSKKTMRIMKTPNPLRE